jgi:hypothetical protein
MIKPAATSSHNSFLWSTSPEVDPIKCRGIKKEIAPTKTKTPLNAGISRPRRMRQAMANAIASHPAKRRTNGEALKYKRRKTEEYMI